MIHADYELKDILGSIDESLKKISEAVCPSKEETEEAMIYKIDVSKKATYYIRSISRDRAISNAINFFDKDNTTPTIHVEQMEE